MRPCHKIGTIRLPPNGRLADANGSLAASNLGNLTVASVTNAFAQTVGTRNIAFVDGNPGPNVESVNPMVPANVAAQASSTSNWENAGKRQSSAWLTPR